MNAEPSDTSHDKAGNGETISSYESCAVNYARSTAPMRDQPAPTSLVQFVSLASSDCAILEIGSGPGWDADWLESQGLSVERTDAAEAFVSFQRERGKEARRLDVTRDEIEGFYDGVVARYVLQHIDREQLPSVFAKIAAAMKSGGVFLITLREGDGTGYDDGSDGRRYYVAMWRERALRERLAPLDFDCISSQQHVDLDGHWLTLMLRKGVVA